MNGKYTLTLCTPCAVAYKENYNMKRVKTGVDMKIRCDQCKKMRLGAVYEVSPRRAGLWPS